ncbi:hypothetical protein M758_UG251100 [Ceratodon purpureus]|nr:hypothetical protein M758_UG251100 [Ceratodon purpureus]
MTNDTLLELRNIIRNYNNRHNPLTAWEKAEWTYVWAQDKSTPARYYIFPMMHAGRTDVVFENSRAYIWRRMPEEIYMIIMTTPESKIQDITALIPTWSQMFTNLFSEREPLSPPKPEPKKQRFQELDLVIRILGWTNTLE